MLDAAMEIEYLHHGNVTPIVHCDLKPTNVLLDEDMVARVGDFGISKILTISKSMAYTETLGTLGYIAPGNELIRKDMVQRNITWTRLKRQRVVALTLPNLQLQGTISPSLANLSFLSVLNLKNNSFHGSIPYGLGHLPRLRVIDIQNNQLEGSIPTSLFQYQRVQVISLDFNKLGGEMWRGPCLTGIIPPSIGNATKMMNFSLFGNRVSGNIPKEVINLSQLADLYLIDNQLTGSIPAEPFNISSLRVVSLYNNSLSGRLLLDEGNIVSNLKVLSISYNQISGSIPSNICQLTELKAINGTIPASLGNISTLNILVCRNNRIVGQIPPELGKLSNLLIGQIPEAIFNISSMELEGEIPETIFNRSSLVVIALNFNNLSGRIPTTAGLHLPNLKVLDLGVNQLVAETPLFITNASKLEILDLSDNFLTGTIPTNLGNLRDLRDIFLHTNQLINEPREYELRFFNSLVDCRMLRYLEVGLNPLNGVLPNSIGNLSSTIEVFEMSHAHINGLIPTSIGNISGLLALDFQRNNFMGSIPSDVGELKQLQGLYLKNNKLQGHIPEASA
ncbi:LRR receptor-like serine/threonine-protein kinase FLS2 [Solanum dulcamara]|uniref:LRR receptor-like serine/threonine-protein kinase FLS2 n=1 Tax=Solanum dulcamara TaxID=45834 RepID=UPI002485D643|nr:LRR receptor-like serine/threonine-protein kinase FLS2 [Solanum dulcamara]